MECQRAYEEIRIYGPLSCSAGESTQTKSTDSFLFSEIKPSKYTLGSHFIWINDSLTQLQVGSIQESTNQIRGL